MNQVQCAEDSNPRETIQTLQALRAKYASAGGRLDPPQFTAIILSAMPEKYRPLLHALIATTRANSQTLNPNDLISHITEAAKHDFVQAQAKKDDAALAARVAGKRGNQTNPPKREGKCDNCGKEGHWQVDCWSKGGGKEGQRPKGRYSSRRGKKSKNENAQTANEPTRDDEHAFICLDVPIIIRGRTVSMHNGVQGSTAKVPEGEREAVGGRKN
jgi:hypothetical protein